MEGMETLFEVFAEKAEEHSQLLQDDYIGEDDLLYCGKCHTRKQHRGKLFDKEIVVTCLCRCKTAERDAERERQERQKFFKNVESYRRMGFPESDMREWTFANDDGADPRIMRAMKNYADKFDDFLKEGKGLLLYGGVGTGKTYAAACITNRLIDQGHQCLMTNFARILNTTWGMDKGKQEYYDSLNRFALLVLDDLGAERRSEYAQEQVFNIIDSRYRAKRPLIITTNLSIEEIKKPDSVGNSRIYDRVLEMCHPVEIAGQSRRRQKVKNNYIDMNTLLGL